jgi:hypothetical protein
MNIKSFLCRHSFEVREAVFQYGLKIPPEASKGLTKHCIYSSDSSHDNAAPNTIIKTFYVVNGRTSVSLFCRVCTKCGAVRPCDAFEYQKYRQYHEILSSEGL